MDVPMGGASARALRYNFRWTTAGVGNCPNWTLPNYWGYHLQQILKSDVQNLQNGTFTKPCTGWWFQLFYSVSDCASYFPSCASDLNSSAIDTTNQTALMLRRAVVQTLPAWSSTPRVPGLSWMWWCQGTFGTDLGPCIHFCLVLWGQQLPRKNYPNLYIYIYHISYYYHPL